MKVIFLVHNFCRVCNYTLVSIATMHIAAKDKQGYVETYQKRFFILRSKTEKQLSFELSFTAILSLILLIK